MSYNFIGTVPTDQPTIDRPRVLEVK